MCFHAFIILWNVHSPSPLGKIKKSKQPIVSTVFASLYHVYEPNMPILPVHTPDSIHAAMTLFLHQMLNTSSQD